MMTVSQHPSFEDACAPPTIPSNSPLEILPRKPEEINPPVICVQFLLFTIGILRFERSNAASRVFRSGRSSPIPNFLETSRLLSLGSLLDKTIQKGIDAFSTAVPYVAVLSFRKLLLQPRSERSSTARRLLPVYLLGRGTTRLAEEFILGLTDHNQLATCSCVDFAFVISPRYPLALPRLSPAVQCCLMLLLTRESLPKLSKSTKMEATLRQQSRILRALFVNFLPIAPP